MATASRFSNALLYGPALRVARYAAPVAAGAMMAAAPMAEAAAPAAQPAAMAAPAAPVRAGNMPASMDGFERRLGEGGQGPADSFADGMGPNPGSGWGDFSRGALGVLGAITNPIGFGVTALGTGLYDALSGRTVGTTLNGLFGDVIGGDRPVSQWDQNTQYGPYSADNPAGPSGPAPAGSWNPATDYGPYSAADPTGPGASSWNPATDYGPYSPDNPFGPDAGKFGGDYGGGEGGAQSENTSSGGDNKSDTSGSEGGYGGGDAGFMRGGYTGAGSDGMVQPWREAGTVHEGEVVWPADAVRRAGGPRSALAILARYRD